MCSKIALKLYGMIKQRIIKSNAQFWHDFFDKETIDGFEIDLERLEKELYEKGLNLICAFDDKFPRLNLKLNSSEKPFLFVYKGSIDLLSEIDNNIAVVGVLNPTEDIEFREQRIVKTLVDKNLTIVSGLAKGCDTIAHKTCLKQNAKTIAILPTTFDRIYPKENKSLVDEIVKNNGLVITEYINEPQSKFDRIRRFIDRDRLQAMYSKAVILVASFTQGNGDCGSRYAMQRAKEYGRARYVMFDENTDNNKLIFGLNKIQILDGANIITGKIIKELIAK